MTKVIAGKVYVYRPVGIDLFDSRCEAEPGELLRVVNLPGCPRANTMEHCHVQYLDNRFAGLVLCASLEKEKTKGAI